MKRRRHRTKGFTLVEMLMVVVILGVLLAIIVGVTATVQKKGNIEQTKTNMRAILAALGAYYDIYRDYPVDSNPSYPLAYMLAGAGCPGKCKDKLATGMPFDAIYYISGSTPSWSFLDGFGRAMTYAKSSAKGGGPLLTSPGPDGDPNTAADNIYSDDR